MSKGQLSSLCIFLCLTLMLSPAVNAEGQATHELAESDEDIEQTDADIMSMDVGSSIINAVNARGFTQLGFDVRAAATWSDKRLGDGGSDRDDGFTTRLRLEGKWNPREALSVNGRVALVCTDESCSPDLSFESGVAGTSIDAGKITLDEFFLQWFRTERFNLAAGRLQTRFVTRGGVFAKSLDRNNSNNTSINWTDGVHGTVTGKGWVAHLILEYNDEDGTGSVRRSPLDFSTHRSEVTPFVAVENTKLMGYIVQRAIGISYLPDSLLKDGEPTGRRKDYWGIVARMAARFPLRGDSRRLQVAGEIGYAPETPTRQAVGTGTSGDTDGLAWNVSTSLMDFVPGHSIGVLYGRTGSGWLLSPQFGNNEEQIEARWSWRMTENLTIDARIRRREDLHRLLTAQRQQKELDVFLRLTWRYSRKRIRGE